MHDPAEREVLAAVLGYLSSRADTFAWRNNTGTVRLGGRWVKFGQRGSADVLGVCAGRAIAVEVKRPSGRLSASQQLWGARFERAGGLYVVARCVADVATALGPPVP